MYKRQGLPQDEDGETDRKTTRQRETETERESYLVSWCFKPSQPQRIISGLRETFLKRYIVERTNKTEIRSEEQSTKAESCWGEFME